MNADPVKNIAEIGKGINPMQFTAGDKTVSGPPVP
jgi:hypothetical protein